MSNDTETKARILLINSYHPQYDWTAQLTQGVKNTLSAFLPDENFHVEYMDARRFVSDPVHLQHLTQLLLHKYRSFKPDVVITADDAAFYFLLNHPELFADTPVVFGGVNVFKSELLQDRDNFTGILEGMEISGNIKLIEKIQPEVQQVILLADKTELGSRMTAQARLELAKLTTRLSVKIWDDFSLAELQQSVRTATPDTAYLILGMHKDRNGQYFSFSEHLLPLTNMSTVPIYGMWGAILINQGVMGGLMNNPLQHGASLAQIAKDIIRGKQVSDIPIRDKSDFVATFNYRQLQRFDINLDLLPKGSRIEGRSESFYQKYTEIVHASLAVFTILLAAIALLALNIQRRMHAEKQLLQLNKVLDDKVRSRTEKLQDANVQLNSMMDELKQLAHTDPLTSLYNRRAGMKKLNKLVTRCISADKELSLVLLDIDYFKRINDNYGHDEGDRILIALAKTLDEGIRPTDFLYRWGGEEFLLLFPNTSSLDTTSLCKRLQSMTSNILVANEYSVTFSAGIAQLTKDESSADLLKRADEALYQAKGNGRNRVEVSLNLQINSTG
ncbi:ABC transporter substrate binding protein [Catenovulum sp. SX2]|uniref:ABC transporter substrate binding protein n=1 Tax=Catenovulum sp. SX2 TaxID=3398614 RepID=UPI003F83BF7D